MASATRRARQAGTRPSCTCSHKVGSRQASSNACPINRRPASVVSPTAAANSATAQAAISGVPSPASGIASPASHHDAASARSVGSWSAAHSTAADNSPASATTAAR